MPAKPTPRSRIIIRLIATLLRLDQPGRASRLKYALIPLLLFSAGPHVASAQQAAPIRIAAAALPDAPAPVPIDFQTASSSTQAAPQTTTPAATPTTPPTQAEQDRSAAQVKKQEKQRLMGVLPNFNISYDQDAPPLRPGQKFDLAFHTIKDHATFGVAAIDALYSQATDDFGPDFDTARNSAGQKVVVRHEGYGQGVEGYAKRFGASYLDNADGTILGNALFPVLLKEDPRFFRKGTGTFTRRLLYAMSTTVWCKRDKGNWGPNYANVLGNLAAGGISNLYYPSEDRGAGLTFSRGLYVTAYGTVGGVLNEFLPDITRHFLHRDISGKKVDASATTAPTPAQPAPAPQP